MIVSDGTTRDWRAGGINVTKLREAADRNDQLLIFFGFIPRFQLLDFELLHLGSLEMFSILWFH